MKKIVLIILSILFITPAFAEYKPIPKELSKQYKAEIEEYIKVNAEYYKRQMDKEFFDAEKIFHSYFEDKKNKDNYIDKLNDKILGIDSMEFDFYRKMIIITMKYEDIKDDLPKTDWVGDYILFLKPYLKDNKVKNRKKIRSISFYAYKKSEKINNMIDKITESIF